MTVTGLIREATISRQDAEALLATVLVVERAWIYAHGDEQVNPGNIDRFRKMAAARADGEPLAYLLGYRDFWTLRLRVNRDVLIPRRETEHLVEWANECITAGARRVLDLGTGSGAVALSCKAEHPEADVCATDLSPKALACARANGDDLNLSVDWREGDWFDAVPGERWQLILSNPPYIAAADPHLNEGDLPAEPARALISGETGLESLRHIIGRAPDFIEHGGWLLLEHGFDQASPLQEALFAGGFSTISTRRDWSGQERITGGQWLS
jgi:release factor glutamine methyltransferase